MYGHSWVIHSVAKFVYVHCNLVNVNSNIVKCSKSLQLNRKMKHASKMARLFGSVGVGGGFDAVSMVGKKETIKWCVGH